MDRREIIGPSHSTRKAPERLGEAGDRGRREVGFERKIWGHVRWTRLFLLRRNVTEVLFCGMPYLLFYLIFLFSLNHN